MSGSRIKLIDGKRICKICLELKQLDKFVKGSSYAYGRSYICRKCYQLRRRNYAEKKSGNGNELVAGKRKCIKCGVYKKLDEFKKEKACNFGRGHVCLDCYKKREKKKHLKRLQYPVINGKKQCNRCGEWKNLDDFPDTPKKYISHGKQRKCKQCQKEDQKKRSMKSYYKKGGLKKERDNLEDWYVKQSLYRRYGILYDCMDENLIELKRLHIQLFREARKP